jgi:HJR/Mrr/RecB family endonuclease
MDNPTPNLPKLPQPVDFGLTYKETFNGLWLGGECKFRDELPDCEFREFSYKDGEWIPFWSVRAVVVWLALYTVGFVSIAVFNHIPGGWTWDNPRALGVFFLGMVFPGFFLLGIICAVDQSIREVHAQKKPSESLLAFRHALSEYKSALIAARNKCESDLITARKKREYWEALDGQQFEIETAKVLGLHRLNPTLTGGPADGGIDIEVNRDGVRGVVQCKAHTLPIGPHVIRDLFGVMYHSRAGFGIVASRAGFTPGAVEFAKGKFILLIDISDLIAMAEGKNIFDSFFTNLAGDGNATL